MRKLFAAILGAALLATEVQAQFYPTPQSPDPYGNTIFAGGIPSKPTSNTNCAGNTAIGSYSLAALTNGTGNTALGFGAGNGLSQGSNNVYLGALGLSNDMSVVRIGNGQSNVFLSGAIVSGAGSGGVLNVVPGTPGFSNNYTVGGTFYYYATNGVATLCAGFAGTNRLVTNGAYIGGGQTLIPFYMQNGWSIIGTNTGGIWIPGP
jgi:hypothetical protein